MELSDIEQDYYKRTLPVFFLVDISPSMLGDRIKVLNSSIEEFIPELKAVSEFDDNLRIKVIALVFSTEVHWIDNEPVRIEEYKWQHLEADTAPGNTIAFSEACDQLNEKLSRKTLLTDMHGYYAPIIFLFTDRDLTDEHNQGLEKLKQNNWFKRAIKVAVAIGENANKNVLADFTGNMDSVITTCTPEALKKQIRIICIGSPQTNFVQYEDTEISNKNLSVGTTLKDRYGKPIEIVDILSEGSSNSVYLVNYDGKSMVLKWFSWIDYYNPNAFYDQILRNVELGAPSEYLLWPNIITERIDGRFGYIMQPIPSEYEVFTDFLIAKVHFASVNAIINAALCIIRSFRELHRRGLYFQYISYCNIWINPQTGDVLICNNDNIMPYGLSMKKAGSYRYMAPEVVAKQKSPDIHTDRYSIAVILYQLLFLDHPLEGKRTFNYPYLTEGISRVFYGSDPIFVWDHSNDTNRPVEAIHKNEIKFWPLYPEFIRSAFERAFSHELLVGDDSKYRITELGWLDVFTALRGVTIRCPKCKCETFVDPFQPSSRCINCDQEIAKHPILKAKKHNIVLAPQQKIYVNNVICDNDDFREEIAVVVTSKTDPSILGLRNLSNKTWVATLPNGASKSFAKDQVIKICSGMKIAFDKESMGEIQ